TTCSPSPDWAIDSIISLRQFVLVSPRLGKCSLKLTDLTALQTRDEEGLFASSARFATNHQPMLAVISPEIPEAQRIRAPANSRQSD
ncbi:MAG TPA: hypothetical protein VFM33_11965, partial [Aquabacterium sp.]|nr:hypothetical protein [Aquabacterium sp.]